MNRFSPLIRQHDRQIAVVASAPTRPTRFSRFQSSIFTLLKDWITRTAPPKTCMLGALGALSLSLSAVARAQGHRQPTLSEIRQYERVITSQVEGGENWSTVNGRYVSLHYVQMNGLNEARAQKVAAVFDQCVESDCRALALDLPSSPVPVYFYPNVNDLKRAIGIKQEFVGGMSLGSWAVVFVAPNVAELQANGAHSIGQALVHQQLGLYGCPIFAEGIAYYLQGKIRNAPWLSKPGPLEATSLSSLVDVAKTPLDFANGGRFIAYLIKHDGGSPRHVKEILTGLNKERIDQIRGVGRGLWLDRANRVFISVYGKNLAQLDRAWKGATYLD